MPQMKYYQSQYKVAHEHHVSTECLFLSAVAIFTAHFQQIGAWSFQTDRTPHLTGIRRH